MKSSLEYDLDPEPEKPYVFETDCVHSTAEAIDDMVDNATDVSYGELVANCSGALQWAKEHGYVRDKRRGLRLQDDWHVDFRKSVYMGRPCYYIQWSGIEHIWVKRGERRLNPGPKASASMLPLKNPMGAPASEVTEARAVLIEYLRRYPEIDQVPFADARFEFGYQGRDEDWWRVKWSFSAVPRGGKTVIEPREYAPDRPRIFQAYKKPANALPEVPQIHGLGYRGMCWEEWQDIRRAGRVQSIGVYNIDQPDYTMFGMKAGTAEYYATGFAPIVFRPGHYRPGVVIALPADMLRSHKEDPKRIDTHELALVGSAPISALRGVWLMVPTKIQHGTWELRRDHTHIPGRQAAIDLSGGTGHSFGYVVVEDPDWAKVAEKAGRR